MRRSWAIHISRYWRFKTEEASDLESGRHDTKAAKELLKAFQEVQALHVADIKRSMK
jgi:hypothetical protein